MAYPKRNQRRHFDNVEVQVGQQFKMTIKRMGINGEGIGFYEHKLVFVTGAFTNEKVVAEVTQVRPNFLRAKAVKINRVSDDRVTPRDDYAGTVGGFELESLSYPAQLRFKRDLIQQALEKFQPQGYKHFKIRSTMGMDEPYGYRNKAQFPVREKDGKVIAGLFKEGTHELVDLPTCSVQYPATMKVMRKIVEFIQELNIPVFDESNHSGIIKTVIVRAALNTDDVQVVFVTNTPKFVKKGFMLKKIMMELPEVTSVMQNINPGDSPLIWGDKTVHLAGKATMTEKIKGLSFELSPRAFLQLNSIMLPRLYEVAISALELTGNEKIVDAYSGVGTIGLPLAKHAEEIRGMDIIPEAVEDANQNAIHNKIRNAHYEVGKAEDLLPEWLAEGFKPDAIIVDPPRTGLDDKLIEAILKSAPDKFVYVSCNPSTLAADLVPLTRKYNVDFIQPIDMMPQTPRCEAVVKFTKK
ncbi:23S rRNA (uracil(1939)-C(5))-methyltransferase RlmD [Apilactobacillus bombintestini]|uniref:23S rRNA (Uracil(1939)-C(5))-methyltransferase RlmD n=1 Tax=Apilactobacillus bombintestini TaxID=2419772 RepID=A0A387AWG6_9LACO|nr:23S rRNA (uracil(1939)-C(5))-methyltransferase RlmD [Apilactobacillus bombintestini]AYF92996.1 23S rRNA (uracil(1939)-C(5))-methyltransferase RlmD [Apilactobacillus bombintestini]